MRSVAVRLDVTPRVGLRSPTRLLRPGGLWWRRRPGSPRRRPPAGGRWQPNPGRRTPDRLVAGPGLDTYRSASGPRYTTRTAPPRRTGRSRSACPGAGGRGRRRSGSAAGCQQVVDARGWPRCALLGSSWTSCCYSLGVLVPGGGLVVAGAGFEAAVQDSDETVAELAQGCVVADVAVPQRVVVGAGSRRSAQGAERLLVQGIGQAVVTHVSGQDDFLLARGPGDGAGARVVLAGTGALVAGC